MNIRIRTFEERTLESLKVNTPYLTNTNKIFVRGVAYDGLIACCTIHEGGITVFYEAPNTTHYVMEMVYPRIDFV
jgi:hypothetical protein